MLSDYIPVYWPKTNTWSIPNYELEKYEDYVPEPQDITLYKGHVVRGIPLLHFGTWGIVGVDVTETIRAFAKSPETTSAESFSDKKVAADTAAFFSALASRYPEILRVECFKSGRTRASKDLRVPEDCIVSLFKDKEG